MKRIIILFILTIFSIPGFSQKAKHHPSYVGISIQPSHYWLYNKDEFTAPDTVLKINNDSMIINSLSYGLIYGHFLKKSLGFSIQLLYSNQTQYFMTDKNPGFPAGAWVCYTNLKYLNLPVNIINRKEISFGNFVLIKYGFQFSYLTEATDYSYDNYNEYITEYRNNTFYSSGFTPEKDKKYFYDWRYKRFAFGGNLFVGFEHYFNNKFSFDISLNTHIDFTNIDNKGALRYVYQTDEKGNIIHQTAQYNLWQKYRYPTVSLVEYDRKPSHNIHLGLEFGFKYWFGEKALHIERKIPREW